MGAAGSARLNGIDRRARLYGRNWPDGSNRSARSYRRNRCDRSNRPDRSARPADQFS